MRLPHIATRLREIAEEENLPELYELADEIRRRPATRGPVESDPCDRYTRAEIRRYRRANPHLTQQEIARRFNVNSGRVSEALKGWRR